jgi:hypothetical protein
MNITMQERKQQMVDRATDIAELERLRSGEQISEMDKQALREYYNYLFGPNGPEYWRSLPPGTEQRYTEFEKQHPMGMRGEFDYTTDIPRGYDPNTGARILGGGANYRFPQQGLLKYGTRSGDGLRAGGYSGTMDYPEHAPNTPEAKQAYNFLRFNNKGGGI